jgi:DNA-binding transcriptional LysR family regulator
LQDLNDLHYFAQVVRRDGFSAASRATGEPEAKLSKRVAQLERDLGEVQGKPCEPSILVS